MRINKKGKQTEQPKNFFIGLIMTVKRLELLFFDIVEGQNAFKI
jgi:hypothetical protein